MKSIISVIGIIFLLAIFLSGCGEDEEIASTSINVPINLSPTMAQGNYLVKVTVTAPDMSPVTGEKNITIEPGSSKTYDMTVNNVPLGSNRNVKVEIEKDGKLLFEGSGVANLSSTAGASLPIKVEPVGHKLVADFAISTSQGPSLQNGIVKVDASKSYDTHYGIEVAGDWGDGEKTDFSPVLTAKHEYSKEGEYTITLTVKNKTNNNGPAVSKHIDTIKQNVNVYEVEIYPGKGAAGITLGDPFSKAKSLYGNPTIDPEYPQIFSYDNVGLLGGVLDLDKDNVIDNNEPIAVLMLVKPYNGKTAGGNGIGSTRTDVEREFGVSPNIEPDNENNREAHRYEKKGIDFTYDLSTKRVVNLFVYPVLQGAPQKVNSEMFRQRTELLRVHLNKY